MPEVRCDYCFRPKPVAPLLPGRDTPVVCKGCRYELDKAIGFLEHSNMTLQHNMAVVIEAKGIVSDTPPTPPEDKRKATS